MAISILGPLQPYQTSLKMIIRYRCPCGIYILDADTTHKDGCLPFQVNGWGKEFNPTMGHYTELQVTTDDKETIKAIHKGYM